LRTGEPWASVDGVGGGCGSYPLRQLTLEVKTPGAVVEEVDAEKETEVEGDRPLATISDELSDSDFV
jgi:hypothetical protein